MLLMRSFQEHRLFCTEFLAIGAIVVFSNLNANCDDLLYSDKVTNTLRDLPRDLQFEPPWRHKGDCGPLSLYVLMRLQDRQISVAEVQKKLIFSPENGCSLADISRAADKLDFATETRFVNPHDLPDLPFPFILHTNGSLEQGLGHFLVIVGYSPEYRHYFVIDTTYDIFRPQTEESILTGFSGYVLLPMNNSFVMQSRLVSWALLGVGGGVFIMLTISHRPFRRTCKG